MGSKERKTIDVALLACSNRGWFVWRNNTGALLTKTGQLVRFGISGSSDIIGVRGVEITPDMVGKKIGQLVAIEVKTGKQTLTETQKQFRHVIESMGGHYEVANADKGKRDDKRLRRVSPRTP